MTTAHMNRANTNANASAQARASANPRSGAGPRLGLVTGATGYVGGELVGRLLAEGWRVRVLTRHRDGLASAPWSDRVRGDGERAGAGEVEVVEGDAANGEDLQRALAGVEVAWYLLHSMGDVDDFRAAEREMAEGFARAAASAGIRRIVSLGGLHPEGEELSEHLASRVDVGRALLASGVPTAQLQAGIVIGDGSDSFAMLRSLAERLPGAFGPKWLRNRITPIGIRDLLRCLVAAAELPATTNRAFDIGGPDTMPYAEMLDRYARAVGLGPRPVLALPVMTPRMAAAWISLVSPVPHGLVTPLVASLQHETVVKERDLEALIGAPDGGWQGFEETVAAAMRGLDPRRYLKVAGAVGAGVAAVAIAGSLATDVRSMWYRTLRKPPIQPPAWLFPVAWTTLYADIAWMSSLAIADLGEAGEPAARERRALIAALAANLALNAGWSAVFFRGRAPRAATLEAALLAASSIDLVRRVAATDAGRGILLAPYAAWTSFATLLSGAIARRNPPGALDLAARAGEAASHAALAAARGMRIAGLPGRLLARARRRGARGAR